MFKIRFKFQHFLYNFRASCQRFKRGYAYRDVWDMDHWFISTVKPMLIHLRTHGCGIPCDLYVDEENTRAKWESVLDEMINCLDFMDEDKVIAFLGFVEDEYWKRMTMDDWKQVSVIVEENKNRFFELFSKYFFALWD